MTRAKSNDPVFYHAQPQDDEAIVARALAILQERATRSVMFGSPQAVKDWLTVALSGLEYEVFGVLMLDAQHRLIADERMFRGTLTQASIYPREIVKSALMHNAAAVILYHNHPSGVPEPSRADEMLTRTLNEALKLVDVRILDHMVVGGGRCASFAERGLI